MVLFAQSQTLSRGYHFVTPVLDVADAMAAPGCEDIAGSAIARPSLISNALTFFLLRLLLTVAHLVGDFRRKWIEADMIACPARTLEGRAFPDAIGAT